MEIPQSCGCDARGLYHRSGCLAGPQLEIPRTVEAVDAEGRFFLLRAMTKDQIKERDELNRAVTSESIRARALASRASLNGHVVTR